MNLWMIINQLFYAHIVKGVRPLGRRFIREWTAFICNSIDRSRTCLLPFMCIYICIFTCVTWLIHMWDLAYLFATPLTSHELASCYWYIYVYTHRFRNVTWLIYVCGMAYLYGTPSTRHELASCHWYMYMHIHICIQCTYTRESIDLCTIYTLQTIHVCMWVYRSSDTYMWVYRYIQVSV